MDFDTCDSVELQNRQRLSGWWARAGLAESYPASTMIVAELMQAAEYAVDHETLVRGAADGWFPSPERDGTRLTWSATDIVKCACACEARRMWAPFSALHSHKFNQIEKLQQLLDHRGEETFSDLSRFDFGGLLGLLVDVSHDQGAVQVVAAALKFKLKEAGIQ